MKLEKELTNEILGQWVPEDKHLEEETPF